MSHSTTLSHTRRAMFWLFYYRALTDMDLTSQLCLAHYCDTHGPTPLMVTEGLPVPCTICFGDDPETERPKSGRRSHSSAEDRAIIRGIVTRTISSAASENDLETQSAPRTSLSSPTIDTPPQSPRVGSLSIGRNGSRHRRDSSFRKTYDENDRKRAIPCENCALTLPKKVQDQASQAATGSPTKNGNLDNVGPILRTRKPYEKVSTCSGSASPPSDSDESRQDPSGSSRGLKRSTTYSSASSISSSSSQSHHHYIDYISTHDPLSSTSFSILRASCLRTLSCETLPPNTSTTAPSTPTSPLSWNANRSFPSAAVASTSGGPIFFGDPLAGYTTAYIFRIPDPYARGRRRVYAFICLSSARERPAMRAFSFLSAAFGDLASWIQALAEGEGERMECSSPGGLNTPANSLFQRSSSISPPSSCTKAEAEAAALVSTSAASERNGTFTPPLRTSAFLSGRPSESSGFARNGMIGQIRSRGLAELVGQPDFFIELHARFVALLAQLAVLYASGS